MCLGETIFKLNFLGDLWATQTWMFKSLPRFGESSAIIYLSILLPSSSLFLGSINLRFFLTVISHRLGRLYSFFFNLFSFFSSEWIILSIWFSNLYILSSAWSILILMLSVLLIFISFIVFFSFRISVWIFSIVSISLLNLKKKKICVLFFLFQWIVLPCFLVTHWASLNNYSEFFVGYNTHLHVFKVSY